MGLKSSFYYFQEPFSTASREFGTYSSNYTGIADTIFHSHHNSERHFFAEEKQEQKKQEAVSSSYKLNKRKQLPINRIQNSAKPSPLLAKLMQKTAKENK